MATKTKYTTVSLPIDLIKLVDKKVKVSPEYISRAEFIRKATAELLKNPGSREITLTQQDKTFLEVIAQDHWVQFQSFEEKELAESIISNFKEDLSKPKNLQWLAEAIVFCCSLKRN